MTIFTFAAGATPLLISMPHVGTALPDRLADRLTPAALALPDTDWHVERLYDFADALGAHTLQARYSRYVIDLNRPSNDESLYPGQVTTGLCPTTLFDGQALYRPGQEPTAAEIAERRERFWQPYHAMLAEQLERIRAEYGYALLYDAHSIRSRVPRLFDGRLPDLNIGTVRGRSASPALAAAITAVCRSATGYETVVDGRFIGGEITRRYGDPARRVEAVQMELAQATYMDETPPYPYAPAKASRLRPVLRQVLEAMLGWGRETYG